MVSSREPVSHILHQGAMGAGCSTSDIDQQEAWVADRAGLIQEALNQSFPNSYSIVQIKGKLRQEYNSIGRVCSPSTVDDYVLDSHWRHR